MWQRLNPPTSLTPPKLRPNEVNTLQGVSNWKRWLLESAGLLFLAIALAVCSVFLFPKHYLNQATTLVEGEVSAKAAWLKTEKFVWIDARPRPKYETAHVPDAILLNEEEWDSCFPNLTEAWSPGMTIVVYCEVGCRSSYKVAERLRDKGMEPVFVLKGGWQAWRAAQ